MAEMLTLAEVEHVARLARLELPPDQLERYRVELSSVLEHIAKLAELDLDGVEPMARPFESTNRLDDDVVAEPMPLDRLLANAPATEGRYLAVPKVLGET